MVLRELVVKLGFNVDETKLKNFDKWINKTSQNLKKVSKQVSGVGKEMSLKLTLPIVALSAVMVKAASDAEETESKFGVVYSNIANEANKMADELDKSYGLSANGAKTLLSDTGDLLTGFGFTQKSALDLSGQVQKLAVDLASFTNFSGGAEGASKALTKALLGERESVKSLGISILDEDVKARVLINTQKGMTFETERQAKAYATLLIAQEQSKNAIGDYARTQDGFANQMRETWGDLNDLAVAFGKILLPAASAALAVVKKGINFLKGLSENSRKLILVILGILAVIGPLLLAFGTLLGFISFAITGFTGLAASIGITSGALALLMIKFIVIGALIAAAFAVIFLVIDDLIAFFNGEDSITGIIVKKVGEMYESVKATFIEMGQWIKDSIGEAIDFLGEKFNDMPNIVKTVVASMLTPLRVVISTIRTMAGVIGALVSGDFSGALDAVTEGFDNIFNQDTVKNNGLGGLLGFGPSEKPTPAGGGGQSIGDINAPIMIEVPPGTPPEEVATAAKQGIMESLDSLFQDTGRQLQTPMLE